MNVATADGTTLLAHGMSGGRDVPVPFGFAVTGAAIAVILSFVIATILHKDSVLRGGAAGRAVPDRLERVLDGRPLRLALRVLGLAGAGYFVLAAGYGPTDPNVNPAPGVVYVFFWFGLVPLSLLFGPVWKLVNPLRTLHLVVAAVAGVDRRRGIAHLPRWIGYWPAAFGLLAFTWLELVAPRGDQPRVLLGFFLLYGLVHLVAAGVFGARWFERADAFEAYSSLAGRLAVLGRRGDGRLAVRNPFDGLDSIRPAPGLVALACVWLGSTAYDGFTRSGVWREILEFGLENNLLPLDANVIRGLGFVLTIVVVAALYLVCTLASAKVDGSRRALPRQFAHTLVPIAIGYTIAHYFTLALFAGQRTLALSSDPLDNGSDLFGTAGRQPDYQIMSSDQIALVQIGAVLIGHVLGVIAAHDRAARLFPRRQAILGQLPLLVLMVTYTFAGLSLLFAS